MCKNYGVTSVEIPFLLEDDDSEDKDGKSSAASVRYADVVCVLCQYVFVYMHIHTYIHVFF